MKYKFLIFFILLVNLLHSYTYKGMSLTDWSVDGYNSVGQSLDRLKSNNVNFVAINVFVYQDNRYSTSIYKDSQKTSSDSALINAINQAHSRGMRVLLKVNVDAKDDTWRGHFAPSDVDAWFNSYKTIMTQYARIAKNYNVEIFSVGCEYESLSGSGNLTRWQNVINAIKNIYSGLLVYSANWTEYKNVSFWNEIHYIGIDAYFPLDDNNNANANDIKNDWSSSKASSFLGRNWISEIDNFRQTKRKDVIFTEIGYPSANGAAKEPWRWDLYPVNLTLQSNCYRGTLLAWKNYNWFKGFFWWDWGISLSGGGSSDNHHTPMNKPAEKVLKEFYGTGSSTNTNNNNNNNTNNNNSSSSSNYYEYKFIDLGPYPNPLILSQDKEFTIRYEIKNSAKVRIKLYDFYMNFIADLYGKSIDKAAGVYEDKFDIKYFKSPGLYIYVIEIEFLNNGVIYGTKKVFGKIKVLN